MALFWSLLCRDDRYETRIEHRGVICVSRAPLRLLLGVVLSGARKGRLCEKRENAFFTGSRAAKVQSFVYSCMHACIVLWIRGPRTGAVASTLTLRQSATVDYRPQCLSPDPDAIYFTLLALRCISRLRGPAATITISDARERGHQISVRLLNLAVTVVPVQSRARCFIG